MEMPTYPTGVATVSRFPSSFQIISWKQLFFPLHLRAGVFELRPAALHLLNSSVAWERSVQIARIVENIKNINSATEKNE